MGSTPGKVIAPRKPKFSIAFKKVEKVKSTKNSNGCFIFRHNLYRFSKNNTQWNVYLYTFNLGPDAMNVTVKVSQTCKVPVIFHC